MIIKKVKVTHIPINSNISTTGHKLQGRSLDHLIVNSWAYKCPHWVYVVLPRVITLKSLILNRRLDVHRNFEARKDLLRWGESMKADIETKTFRIRGKSDLEEYMKEESQYNK